eukprot:3941604-Rhodomonas_salina.7
MSWRVPAGSEQGTPLCCLLLQPARSGPVASAHVSVGPGYAETQAPKGSSSTRTLRKRKAALRTEQDHSPRDVVSTKKKKKTLWDCLLCGGGGADQDSDAVRVLLALFPAQHTEPQLLPQHRQQHCAFGVLSSVWGAKLHGIACLSEVSGSCERKLTDPATGS